MTACPACGATPESLLVCAACGTLLVPPEDPDPFELLGLPRTFEVDRAALRKTLLGLQRAMHPDFFAAAGDEARELAESNTAVLNSAHDVLADDRRRADWLVRRLGGPDENEERQMPQAFLMEVMEWNEVLDEARGSEPGSPQRAAALELGATLAAERAERLAAVRDLLTPLPPEGDASLTEARRQLNAVRYVDRALAQIEEIRLEGASSGA